MTRILLLPIVILALDLSCFAQDTIPQDTIVKMNSKKIIAKVIPAEGPKVVYNELHKKRNGKIDKISVSHIKYADGKIEFVRSKSMEDVQYVENKPFVNHLLKSGLSMNFQPGYSYFRKYGGSNTPSELNFNLGGISIKLENRWYSGKKPNVKNGVQLAWFEIAGYFDDRNLTMYIGLLNPGYCGIYKLSEKSGLEYSLNAGFGFLSNYKTYFGANITPKLEYTTGKNSFGIGYSTFLFSSKFEVLDTGSYSRAIFHNINLSYRIKF